MQLNLKPMLAGSANAPKELPFGCELDFSSVKSFGETPFPAPVAVSGVCRSRARVLIVEYTATFTRHLACARCLEPVSTNHSLVFEHTIVTELADSQAQDALILAPGGILDVDELVIADILLELSGVVLCTEDCRGLCPLCGGNRNKTPCTCTQHFPDPRFDALGQIEI